MPLSESAPPKGVGPPRRWGWHHPRAWRISVALFCCFAVAAASLHPVVQAVEWWLVMVSIVAVVLGSAALTRALSPRRWLPSLVAALALVSASTALFARDTAILLFVPTPHTLGNFGSLLREGGVSIASQAVPAEANDALVFLLSSGAGVLAIAADALAVTMRRPALAGLPLAAIVGIPIALGSHLADVFFVLLTAVCWLILLRAGSSHQQTSRSLGVGALAVAAALIVPLVLPPVDESGPLNEGFSGYLANVNPVLSLGDELRRDRPRTILSYSTQSGEPEYLRLVSLRNFGADTWQPDQPAIDRAKTPDDVGAPPGLGSDIPTGTETTWVDVGNLGSPWLPVPYPATAIAGLRGAWFWEGQDLTFASPNRTARGEKYTVSSLLVRPTLTQLESAAALAGAGVNAPDDRFLELPPNLPAIISDTARRATATASNDFDRAVALQDFFRDGDFEYSETAPTDNGYDTSGLTAIGQFLVAKSGYCIHFASAMAVMARTLGIPSRVAVGFLPGERLTEPVEGRAAYRVTTRNVHTWPELFFDGIGWLRFEPTPGRGLVPRYGSVAAPDAPISQDQNASPPATPAPTAAPTDRGDGTQGADSAAASWAWFIAALAFGGVALLLLIPAGVRIVQRAVRFRRLARGHPAATTGWRELLQSVDDLGVEVRATATPREAAAVIAAAARLGQGDWEELLAVLDAVERQSFAGEAPTPERVRSERSAGGSDPVERGVTRVLARLRSVRPWRSRLSARIAPRSVWSRDRFSPGD